MNLWQEQKDPETGESSIKEHKLKTVWQSCKKGDCYFELTNSPTRECTCNKCGSVTYFVLGMQILKDGKIISLK